MQENLLDAWSDIANIKFTEVAVGNVDGMKASDVKQILLFGNIYDPNKHISGLCNIA